MRITLNAAVSGTLAIVAVVVLAQSLLPERVRLIPPPPPVPCRGEPIVVAFSFDGTIQKEWTCKVQCEDKKPRYILYANDRATQCEELPGCNDYGEDHNITCVPPMLNRNPPGR